MTFTRTFVLVPLACFLLGMSGAAVAAEQVIFVVRHAERADGGAGATAGGMMAAANDPPLSASGAERAKRLAAILASADVKHIFTTEFQRTRDTGAPLAEKAGIKPTVAAARDAAALVRQVREAKGNVLIVGHSNTIPDVLKNLGVTAPITIADGEYDNLFVVVRPETGDPALVRLRY